MSQLKERDKQEALQQDEYFKRILANVRPFILTLTSVEEAQLCKVWLDKLNSSISQRSLRNEYLIELYRQLKAGRVGGIFENPPPTGSLAPLYKPQHMISIDSSCSDVSDPSLTSYDDWKENENCVQQRLQSNIFLTPDESISTNSSDVLRVSPIVSFDKQKDDRTNMKHLGAYKHRIDLLLTVIKKLQTQNTHLQQELLEYQENDKTHNVSHLHADIKRLISEVSILKSKLTEAWEAKENAELFYSRNMQHYKNRISEQFSQLKFQLHEAECKNEILNNNLLTMSQKLEDVIRGKERELEKEKKQYAEKLECLHQRYEALLKAKELELNTQMDIIRQKDLEANKNSEEGKERVESFVKKIQDLENKLEEQTRSENKLQIMLVEQYETMKQEFIKMKSELDLATNKENDSLISKIFSLKRTILKLQKSKEKLGQDYERKISHILKNKDLEIKALWAQFQRQKNDLSATLNSEKQCKLSSLLESLEKRYKVLLAAADTAAENQRQDYCKKISMLEEELLQLKEKVEKND